MSAHKNPYHKGSHYAAVLETMRATGQKGFTLQDLRDAGHTNANISVINSPRKSSKRGDKTGRGSYSAKGHVHYSEPLPRKVKAGVKEPQRYVLRWRNPILEPNKRPDQIAISSEKTEAVAAKVKTKTKAKAKVEVKS